MNLKDYQIGAMFHTKDGKYAVLVDTKIVYSPLYGMSYILYVEDVGLVSYYSDGREYSNPRDNMDLIK